MNFQHRDNLDLKKPTLVLDELDRQIIAETQGGLPLVPQPYHEVAEKLGIDPEEVMSRMRVMQDAGVIRRIGLVPNHYALGYAANGMSVWDVEDDQAMTLGARIGALDFVSHCYLRPRHMPTWNFNLFAMVHGRTREEVADKVAALARELGDAVRDHDILYSTKILKKTGFRLNGGKKSGE